MKTTENDPDLGLGRAQRLYPDNKKAANLVCIQLPPQDKDLLIYLKTTFIFLYT